MSETVIRTNGNGSIWKYVALMALSGIGGLLTGQFNPNHNVVTNDQMDAKLAPVQAAQASELLEISSLRDTVSDLKGQLKAQKLLTDR